MHKRTLVSRAYLNDFSTVEIIVQRPIFSISLQQPSGYTAAAEDETTKVIEGAVIVTQLSG